MDQPFNISHPNLKIHQHRKENCSSSDFMQSLASESEGREGN